jgi:spore maturation protein CgeB
MKILVIGDWIYPIYEEAFHRGFLDLGIDSAKFEWGPYFSKKSILTRVQNKFNRGPLVEKLNRDLITALSNEKPDILFIYRGWRLKRRTLIEIKRLFPSMKMILYVNDDPFSPLYPRWYWAELINSICLYDLIFAFREHNLDEFKRHGSKNTELLRPYYVPWLHSLSNIDNVYPKYQHDVIFVGHYENDGRLDYLKSICEMNLKLKIFGEPDHWNNILKKDNCFKHLIPVSFLFDVNYCRELSLSRIALCFLSKLNRDTYTMRNFEIPATKTFMLSEYTDDLATLFKEDKEVVFFRNKNELLEKIKYYLDNEDERNKIAEAGYDRVIKDSHSVIERAKYILSFIEKL